MAARAGDKDAFAELIHTHRLMALRLAGRLLADHDLASDAVQEAALRAYLSLDRLRSPERFAPWFCGITLNVARRWLRERRAIGSWAALTDPAATAGPDEQYEMAEIAASVRTAVSRLAFGQREAVLLFYWQGLTHREVADELSISVGAVKARLHQARAALERTLPMSMTPQEVPVMSQHELSPVWLEVVIAEIRRGEGVDPTRQRHVVVLQERDGRRTLPIWIGSAEASAMALSLETVEMPRPMTYQLAVSILVAAGSQIAEIRITQLAESTFHAVVVVEGSDGAYEVDARPSDALNLALVADSPIKIDARLLDDPRAANRSDWQDYPAQGSELAAEIRARQQEIMAELEER